MSGYDVEATAYVAGLIRERDEALGEVRSLREDLARERSASLSAPQVQGERMRAERDKARAERDVAQAQASISRDWEDRNLERAVRAEAAIARVRALCEQRIAEHADYVRRIQDGTLITLDRAIGPPQVDVSAVLAALDVRHDPSAPLPKYVCGDCGYVWPRETVGPPLGASGRCHKCDGLMTQVPHSQPEDCRDCRAYPALGCAAHHDPSATTDGGA